jgi:3-methylcrotonyl-CoA carboxylase alpha subunit
MEMNTRLQVEHPVTEAITGQDLVEWQLRVASGEALPKRQDELAIDGWAIEARLYAEDPASGFLPSVGRLEWLNLPYAGNAIHFSDDMVEPEARIDAGVARGDEISVFYDPMIAKIISQGANRDEAVARLHRTVGDVSCFPVKTNAGFLTRTLALDDFRSARIDTGFIERHLETTVGKPPIPADALGLAASMLAGGLPAGWTIYAPHASIRQTSSPWGRSGFRLNADASTDAWVNVDGVAAVADLSRGSASTSMVAQVENHVLVAEGGETYVVTLPTAARSGSGVAADGAILAPMPGRIVSIDVAEGDAVTAGQKLVVLEAMKMEQALAAPFDGMVAEVKVHAGGQTSEGALLVRLERTA